MCRAVLDVPEGVFRALMSHLLPANGTSEEAAFLFARTLACKDEVLFRFIDWMPVGPDGFARHCSFFLELTDESRASVIKRAHDLDASIVEFHSHPSGEPEFSFSDKRGLNEFVPHVWWRLRGRPFAAVVVAPGGFDALAWLSGCAQPGPLDRIVAGERTVRPTGWTLKNWEKIGNERGALRA